MAGPTGNGTGGVQSVERVARAVPQLRAAADALAAELSQQHAAAGA
jgi:hypothetical protein